MSEEKTPEKAPEPEAKSQAPPAASSQQPGEAAPGAEAAQEKAPAWEADLESYPLHGPEEDPRWAVRTVWIWVGFALASLVFILTLLVLGAIYD